MLIRVTAKRRQSHIIINALGKCDRQKREQLLDALSHIIKESTDTVKVFISSRDDMDIVRNLAGGPNVIISAKNNQDDIATFVHIDVDKNIENIFLLSGQMFENLRHKMKQVLYDQAQSMSVILHNPIVKRLNIRKAVLATFRFRWVSLQPQYLFRIQVASLVEERLLRLPQDLWNIYHETCTERLNE